MKAEDVKKIIDDVVEKLAHLSKDSFSDFDEEVIHSFRVKVKSLRAFLRFLKISVPDTGYKLTGKFKMLYHIAGNIRDAQLEIKGMTAAGLAFPGYLEHMEQTISHHRKEWDIYYTDNIIPKMQAKLSGLSYEAIHPHFLNDFYEARLTAIAGSINKQVVTADDIHVARKQMKDVLYVVKLATKKWPDAAKEIAAIPIDQLDELADLIGKYNDERLMLAHLAKYIPEIIVSAEKEAIVTFCNEENKRLSTKKEMVTGAIRKLIS